MLYPINNESFLISEFQRGFLASILDIGKEALGHFGCKVVTAETGEEAIEYYESKKEEIIDMVILDLDMPGMGGLSALRSSSN